MTLRWQPVEDAIGYEVLRGGTPGDLRVVDHHGSDLLAVPGPQYVDTTGRPGRTYHYAVAALATIEDGSGHPSNIVTARSRPPGTDHADVAVEVDANGPTEPMPRPWWMIGGEHLSQLCYDEGAGPGTIGQEYAAALARAHDELGVSHVRAHAILDDENAVVTSQGHELVVDAARVIGLYERLLGLGLRPVVELGFMPRALATDPDATVFTYQGIVSPPTSWETWGRVVGDFVSDLVDHFGVDEVAHWPFEVWNEPNLDAFWTGTMDDYHALYDHAARAIKTVDGRLLVGGPATAAVGWIGSFLDHVQQEQVPLDFVTTHVYGTYPLDLRRALTSRDLDDVAVWWTEWGVSPVHHRRVNDLPFGAPFVLSGMKAAAKVADALAYWVVSDHFEELGRPPSLLHGGFGLQTVGNLRKPRYWALALANAQGTEQLPLTLAGDGANGLVDGWASRHRDGTVDVLLWNGTLDQSRALGDDALARRVTLRLSGVPGDRRVSISRVDNEHSNVNRLVGEAAAGGDADWPDDAGWKALAAADELHTETSTVRTAEGRLQLELELPMPGVVRVRVAADDGGELSP